MSAAHALSVFFALVLMAGVISSSPAPEREPLPSQRSEDDRTQIAKVEKRSADLEQALDRDQALRELLLERAAEELRDYYDSAPLPAAAAAAVGAHKQHKRLFAPLSVLPGENPTVKRQIRYHQCYFNPISCFRRK